MYIKGNFRKLSMHKRKIKTTQNSQWYYFYDFSECLSKEALK